MTANPTSSDQNLQEGGVPGERKWKIGIVFSSAKRLDNKSVRKAPSGNGASAKPESNRGECRWPPILNRARAEIITSTIAVQR